jgi:hypothetical protein
LNEDWIVKRFRFLNTIPSNDVSLEKNLVLPLGA